jgi:hypothetical protein
VQRQRAVRDPADRLGRVVVAQRLLDPARDQRGVVGEELALVRVAPQPVERVREQLGRGLVARDDHQVAERLHLHVGEPFSVDLGPSSALIGQTAAWAALGVRCEMRQILPAAPRRAASNTPPRGAVVSLHGHQGTARRAARITSIGNAGEFAMNSL